MIMKYLHRAMSALSPSTPEQREREGRRAFFREEAARINAHREKVRAARERGDTKEVLRLLQPGYNDPTPANAHRLAEVCAQDDAAMAAFQSRHAANAAGVNVEQARINSLGATYPLFANHEDEARYAELIDAKQYGAAGEFARERIAAGFCIEVQRSSGEVPQDALVTSQHDLDEHAELLEPTGRTREQFEAESRVLRSLGSRGV